MIYAYIANGKQRQVQQSDPPDAPWWIRFDAETHTYTTSDGHEYMSVTTWLDSIDDDPFCAERVAIECASKVSGPYAGMTPDEIMARWEDTAYVGTALHEQIEAYLRGEDVDGPQVRQFAEWRALALPDCVRSELILWSSKWHLAGMFDIVSWCPANGLRIDDIKTYTTLTPDRVAKASKQMTLGAMFAEDLLGGECTVGGIVLWENYYNLRARARLHYEPCKDQRERLMPWLHAREYTARQEKEYAMALKMSGGVLARPKRIVIYGAEGVGKSELAAHFPDPVFHDTEGSTGEMDVKRLEAGSAGWNGAVQLYKDVLAEEKVQFGTLVIDTADWLERAGAVIVAKSKKKDSIADIGYGKGEVALASKFKEVLDTLSEIQAKHNVHVVLVCHAWVRHFDPPDRPEGFDRYELKLTKHVAPLVREWCDMLLFCNFVAETTKTDDKVKGVGKGENRRVYTTHTDAYDAKNRCGLPPELPFQKDKRQALVDYLLSGGKAKKEAKS